MAATTSAWAPERTVLLGTGAERICRAAVYGLRSIMVSVASSPSNPNYLYYILLPGTYFTSLSVRPSYQHVLVHPMPTDKPHTLFYCCPSHASYLGISSVHPAPLAFNGHVCAMLHTVVYTDS